jgi:hypothetical protein
MTNNNTLDLSMFFILCFFYFSFKINQYQFLQLLILSGFNSSIITSPLGTKTYLYSIYFDHSYCVFSYTFYAKTSWTNFAQLNISISEGTIKNSLNCTSDGTSNISLTITNSLSGFSSFGHIAEIETFFNVPLTGLITNYLFLGKNTASSSSSSQVIIVLELFDEAEVDGTLQEIIQNLTLVDGQVFLQLTFPSFTSSLYYDPSYQLADLVEGGSSGNNGDGGNSNLTLIVTTSVIIPVAILLILLVIIVILVLMYVRSRRESNLKINTAESINFGNTDEDLL